MSWEGGAERPAFALLGAGELAELMALVALLAVLLLAPLPFASVQPWAWTSALVVLIAGAAALVLRDAQGGSLLLPRAPMLVAGGAVLLLLVLQQVPVPPGLLRAVAPGTAQVHLEALAPQVEAGQWFPVALDRSRALEGTFKVIAYGLAFLLAARAGARPSHARWVLLALVALGCFEAFYGLVERFAGEGQVFGWRRPTGGGERVAGTYVNPDHFAGLLAMAVPAAMAFAVLAQGPTGPLPRERGPRWTAIATHPTFPRRVLLGFAAVVLTVGLCASMSRGGALAATGGVLLLALGLARVHRERRGWIYLLATLLACATWAGALGAERLLERFGNVQHELDPNQPGRLSFVLVALRMVEDFPLLGSGLGSYVGLYARYEPASTARFLVDHAHSDYVELLAELGVPGWTCLMGGLVLTGFGAWRAGARGEDPERAELVLAALGGVAALAVHSLFDFNLRIPANALWGSALLGLAWGAASPEPRRLALPDLRAARVAAGALLVCAAVGVGTGAFLLARGDWIARPFVERARGDDRPILLQIESHEQSLAVWPWSAEVWADLASLRYRAAVDEELENARQAAKRVVRLTTSEEAERKVVDAMFAARLRTSPALAEAQRQAAEEADRAVQLAPGRLLYQGLRQTLQRR